MLGDPDTKVYYSMDKKRRKQFDALAKIVLGEKQGKFSYDEVLAGMFGAVKAAGIKVKKGDSIVLSDDLKNRVYINQTIYSDRDKYRGYREQISDLLGRDEFIPAIGEVFVYTKEYYDGKETIEKKNRIRIQKSSFSDSVNFKDADSDSYSGGGFSDKKHFLFDIIMGDAIPVDPDPERKKTYDRLISEYKALDDESNKHVTRNKIYPENSGQVVKAGKDNIVVSFPFPDGKIRTFKLDPTEIKEENIESVKRSSKEKSTQRLDLFLEGQVSRIGGTDFGDISIIDAQKKLENDFKFKSLQYGNSMPDNERSYHTKWTLQSFSDLSDILNIPVQQITANGKLGIAFGARGKGGIHPAGFGSVAAHYEPGQKMINLTRSNGYGSLAHEWGHFFDNVLTPKFDGYISSRPKYEEKEVTPGEIKHGSVYERSERSRRGAKEKIVRYYFDANARNKSYPFARLDEGQSEPGINSNYVSFYWFSNNQKIKIQEPISVPYMDKARDIAKKSRESLHRQSEPIAKEDPKSMAASIMTDPYFNSSNECFARAFEAYVADKLEDNGRKNTYLSSKEKTIGRDGTIIYPQDKYREEINVLFDEFFNLLRGSDDLKKAILRFGNKIFRYRKIK